MSNIRKGDLVRVIAGKDKGKEGKILRVYPLDQKVIVERVNMVKRHQKSKTSGGPSGIVEKAMKIHRSNVALLDSKSGKPSRIGSLLKDGKKVRVFKKSGELVVTA